jgi:membrane-bound ClpP family serine protease
MSWLILLVLGLLFIFLEFYMPGAVMAIIGSIMLLASIAIFAEQTQSIMLTLLFVVIIGVLLYLLIKYTVKYIPKAKSGFSIYSNKDQEGYQASEYDVNAIGKKGKVISDLKPGGFILVDGKKQAAISESGYISRGTEVIVLSGDGESLMVKEIKLK